MKEKFNSHESKSEINPFIPISFSKRSCKKTIYPANEWAIENQLKKKNPNILLINAIARAFYWLHLLDTGTIKSGSAIAKQENLDASTVNEQLRITLLDPLVISSILEGREQTIINNQWLTRNAIPTNWQDQKKIFNN